MNARPAFRVAIALLTMAAWFVASDHCSLAGAMQQRVTASPAHEHCPGHSTPGKKGAEENLPCCKSLLATSAAPAENVVGCDINVFVSLQYPSTRSPFALWHSDAPIAELNTGPPQADSFAESVLQRSVLAHAPPISLS